MAIEGHFASWHGNFFKGNVLAFRWCKHQIFYSIPGPFQMVPFQSVNSTSIMVLIGNPWKVLWYVWIYGFCRTGFSDHVILQKKSTCHGPAHSWQNSAFVRA